MEKIDENVVKVVVRSAEGIGSRKMQQLQQLYRCGLGEHWRRQIGDVHPSAFARNIGGCEVCVFLPKCSP